MIRVNIIDSYWYNDDENDKLSEDGMRKFHTIIQTPEIFENEEDFQKYINDEGLCDNGSWYEYPDISQIIDYGTGEYLEKSVHIIEEDKWHLFSEGKVEHDVVY
jgi:hypothetical protein